MDRGGGFSSVFTISVNMGPAAIPTSSLRHLYRPGGSASCVPGGCRVALSAMHTIVVGCGRVGSELAINLERQGHSVAIIDKNRRAFQRYLPERWTGRAVLGFGFDRDHLEQAGIREAGALAAATGGDNSNILTARIAKGDLRGPQRRGPDPGPPPGRDLPAPRHPHRGHRGVDDRPGHAPALPGRPVVTEWTDPTGSVSLVERTLPAAWAGREAGRPG